MNNRKIISVLFTFLALILFMPCISVYAATVGKQLTSPEEGWQRIDNTNSMISYYPSTGWVKYSGSLYYNNSGIQNWNNGSSIRFKFYGSKLRIIGRYDTDKSTNIEVKIDGVSYGSFSQYGSGITQILNFDTANLKMGDHYVTITNNTTTAKKYMFLDAIDIDDNGYMIDYNQPTNLESLLENNSVKLSWDIVDGATNYNIKRSETAGGPYNTLTLNTSVSGSSIICTDSTIETKKTYYYVVSAIVSGDESPNSNEVSVTPVESENILKLVLEVNEKKQLSVTDDLADNVDMIWTSSDIAVATVDLNGNVKALEPGNTVITCTSSDGSYLETINVLVVNLDYQLAVDLTVGDTCRLTIDDLANITNVTWIAYDPTIATVSSKGKVTALSEGLTYITATNNDGKEIGRIYIRVRQE